MNAKRAHREGGAASGDMDIMICICEESNFPEVPVSSADTDDATEESNESMEEAPCSWADLQEEEESEERYGNGETVFDEMTGKVLKYEKVITPRLEEIEALKKMGVWEVVPLSACVRRTNRRPIKGRWVDINKGDDDLEVYRSRYVAREIRSQHGGAGREGLFAAMPPIEGLRLLISHAMSRKGSKNPYKLMFIDISKAYLHADVLRDDIYVELPAEMMQPRMCGRLRKALYGTREAARCWEKEYTNTLLAAGFKRGACNPCMFHHRNRDVRVLVQGDDFTISGKEPDLHWVAEIFKQKYKTKVRGIMGPDAHDCKAMSILNRIVEWAGNGISLEADPRHVDIVLRDLGLEKGKGSDITGSRAEEIDAEEPELEMHESTSYRSIAARLNFLAIDRVDIQFACKEICRSMSKPRRSDWDKIKKLGRYLRKHPRHVVFFEDQDPPKDIDTYVDTDYAGCKVTRRSTNGGMMFHSSHLIKSWATTQTVIALSSGEAEYYGVTKGA